MHSSAVWAVNFGPDGQTILAGTRDGTLRCWAASTGLPIGTMRPHREAIWDVQCPAGGLMVLTASADHTVRAQPMPMAMEGPPQRLILWAEVMSGMELHGPNQTARWLEPVEWQQRRRQLQATGAALP
jgi:hypothetical protein